MITYASLYHLNLSKLDTAITSWEETVDKIQPLCDSLEERVQKPFQEAEWEAPAVLVGNAESQLNRASQEYNDALSVAKSVHGILISAREGLTQAKKKLAEIVEVEAPKKGLIVSSTGEVSQRSSEDLTEYAHAKMQAMQLASAIGDTLKKAEEIDMTASWVLRRNIGDDKNDFHSPKGLITSIDEGRKVGEAIEKRDREKLQEQREDMFWRGAKRVATMSTLGPVPALIDEFAERHGYNNTQGASFGMSLSVFGRSVEIEGAITLTKTPDGEKQINVVGSTGTSVEAPSKGPDRNAILPVSGEVRGGEIKSNADDVSQLQGFNQEEGLSIGGRRGFWAEHQTAEGTQNSKGEDVQAYNRGLALSPGGVDTGISSGYSYGWSKNIFKWG